MNRLLLFRFRPRERFGQDLIAFRTQPSMANPPSFLPSADVAIRPPQ
jgi:hypothetical protein